MKFEPYSENLVQNTKVKEAYSFSDQEGNPSFRSKEIYKKTKRFVFFPFSINRKLNQLNPRKIRRIEFVGWNKIEDLPKDFKSTPGYGFNSNRSKQFFSIFTRKFPRVRDLVVTSNGTTKFTATKAILNWSEFESILRQLNKEKAIYDTNRKAVATNSLADLTHTVKKVSRTLNGGELDYFLGKYDSFEKITIKDIESLAKVLSDLPLTKISATNHIIQAKEKIDTVYLEDIIAEFEALLKNADDSEEKWQQFFQKNTWTLTHLFPYEVLLTKGKAYVGGKTFENDEGRIVDFLFETGFQDNFALLEIKTPKKALLKNSPYRAPSVFSVSDELSGGINQCLDQKDVFLREFGQKYKSLDPKCVLVIGKKKPLNNNQRDCFELFRANQKNVDIVTFDEIHGKLQALHSVITGGPKKSKKRK
ncbi:MAG TPA: Shedu immune nuclease family protein [Candidatus Babeliaceae bacterium]|nr:Shedu immune nuclease family protein [Candidatus Babeliaceae bacterium]